MNYNYCIILIYSKIELSQPKLYGEFYRILNTIYLTKIRLLRSKQGLYS